MVPVLANQIEFTPKTKRAVTPQQLQERILNHIEANSLPLVFLGFLGEYKGLKSRIALACTRCGDRADKSATSLLNEGKRCLCFKSDYIQYKSGVPYVYVMKSGNIGKVGITESIIKRRINLGVRNPGHSFEIVFAREMASKEEALSKERLIKKHVVAGGCGDIEYGKTETFIFNPKTLNTIKNFCV
ncbi:hypothetical protein A4L30_10805 [Salmonella enterica subsp. enterica serovar Bovismorbificans]|nr:hypothetical protein [Salmonella enterica subsp. enterica serovar Bovismorbificans]